MANTQAQSDEQDRQPVEEAKDVIAAPTLEVEKPKDDKLKLRASLRAVDLKDIVEKDPVAREKLQEAEKLRVALEQKIFDDLDYIYDEKKQDKTFRDKVGAYMKPGWKVVVALIATAIVAVSATLYGWFIMRSMSELNIAAFTGESAFDAVAPWCGVMAGGCVLLFVSKTISGLLLSQVAEEVTQGFRAELYQAIVRKPIGWHDQRDNGAGIMTATLSSDVQLLNGVSSDGIAVLVEAIGGVLTGLVFSLIFSWPMALVGLGILPFFMIAGVIVAKADNENMMAIEDKQSSDDVSDDVKEVQILSSDSIQNYKTVASFGND